MAVKQLTSADFHETINQSNIPVLVDFYADWCGPCKRISPLLMEISNENEGKALVCKVNVDENPDLASEFSIMSIPCIISFKNGGLHKRIVGVVPKNELLALLD